MNEDMEQLETLLKDPRHEREWIRQNNLIYGGLIGVGVVMVQPFLATPSPELPARVCVVAFAVAIPLLAALLLLNEQEAFERHATRSRLTNLTKAVAQMLAFIGVVAGFWHIWWIAGLSVVVSGAVGVAVHSAGFMGLIRAGSAPRPEVYEAARRQRTPSRTGRHLSQPGPWWSCFAVSSHPRGRARSEAYR